LDRAISERQNDPDALDLQRAAAASHRRGQRLEALRTSVSLLLAAASVLATLVTAVAPIITVLGFAWALTASLVVDGAFKREARRAAAIQEAFDTGLYQMSWNTAFVGQPVPPEDLHRLVRAFHKSDRREERIRDWYPDTTGLRRPYDILLCQQTNLAWDARLRRRYAIFLLTAVLLWSVLGVVVAIAVGLTVIDALLRWYVPSLAALRLGLEGQHAQREVANERERLLELVRAELDQATPGPLPSLRQARLPNQALPRDPGWHLRYPSAGR
jgi:SMODS-associating 4TM effector domain